MIIILNFENFEKNKKYLEKYLDKNKIKKNENKKNKRSIGNDYSNTNGILGRQRIGF